MSSNGATAAINQEKLEAFLGKVVTDFGAALSSSLVYIGQKLGLYKALAAAGASTPAELAERTNTQERYVREWLINQAAGGYVGRRRQEVGVRMALGAEATQVVKLIFRQGARQVLIGLGIGLAVAPRLSSCLV